MMQPTYYNGEDYNTRRYAGYYGRGLGAQSGHYGGGGGNGFTICAVTITGALQIVFGIVAIILGSLIAEEYGLERSGNYTNIGIAIWCGIIYLIAGLIGAFVCCCGGWGSYSTNGAQSCLLLSYMIVSLLAILCALGHLVADAVFLSRINLDDSFYCNPFTNGNCEYLRGLLIGSVVIAVLELLTAITASIFGCTISCCGGGCFGGGLYYGGNAGNMGNVFYGGRDQMLSARGPIGLQGPMLGQGTTTQGPMLMRQAPFMNTVSGGDYYNGGGQYY